MALQSLGRVLSAAQQQPTLEICVAQLTQILQQQVCNAQGQPLRITHQQGRLRAMEFERQVYQHGRLPVRPGSIHDMLNLCMWCLWPATKAALNALHVERGYQGKGAARSAAGNAGTLLDECGIVIVAAATEPAPLIKNHDWQTLFVQQRGHWHNKWHPWVLGHGLLEQMLSPFDGIMGKCLVIPEPTQATPDQVLARAITGLRQPAQLLSLPVLGIPGWHRANGDPAYYRNTRYFRPQPKPVQS